MSCADGTTSSSEGEFIDGNKSPNSNFNDSMHLHNDNTDNYAVSISPESQADYLAIAVVGPASPTIGETMTPSREDDSFPNPNWKAGGSGGDPSERLLSGGNEEGASVSREDNTCTASSHLKGANVSQEVRSY